MKKLLFILFVLIGVNSIAQTYRFNPSLGTVSNKPYTLAQYGPSDGRSFLYDSLNFRWRPFVSTAEVLYYFNQPKYRGGNYSIWINSGGVLSNGQIIGGKNYEYYFKDNCVADSCLVLKYDTTTGTNTSVGNGYKVAVDGTRNIKSLSPAYGILLDSTSTLVSPRLDSGTVFPQIRATIPATVSRYIETSTVDSLRLFNVDTLHTYRLISKGQVVEYYYDPSDVDSPDDGVVTLITQGARRIKMFIQQKIYVESFGAKGDGVSDDADAIQAAFDFITNNPKDNYVVAFNPATYYISKSIILPDSVALNNRPWLFIDGQGATIKTDQVITMFKRSADYTQNYNSRIVNRAIYGPTPIIKGLTFQGTGLTGQNGMDMNAVYLASLESLKFNDLDTAITSRFNLNCTYNKIECFNTNTGIKFAVGLWPGVVGSNCQNNVNTISNSRVYNKSGAYAGFIIRGNQNILKQSVVEGSKPMFAIRVEFTTGELQQNTVIDGLWLEGTGGAISIGTDIWTQHFGLLSVKNIIKNYSADTLLNMQEMDFTHFNRTVFEAATLPSLVAGTFNLRGEANGVGEIRFVGSNESVTRDAIFDPARWVGNVIPSNLHVDDYRDGDDRVTSSQQYGIYPGYRYGTNNYGVITLGGRVYMSQDGTQDFGGFQGNYNQRVRDFFASRSIYMDNAGRYRFGSALVTPDLTLARDSIGQLSILDNSSNYKNVKAARGIFTQRTGYNGYFSLADLGDNDFITKNQAIDSLYSDRIYVEKFGAKGDGVTDDAAAFQAMWDWIAAQADRSYIIAHSHREYLINTTVDLPKVLASANTLVRIKIEGNGVVYNKTTTGAMFYRRPSDQNEALNQMIGAYALTIDGLKIQGNQTAGQIGLDLSALYTPVITNCYFQSLDTAIVATFWLNGRIENNFFTTNKSVAFKGASGVGYWSGAGYSTSAFNVGYFSGNRVFNGNGSYAGIVLLAADACVFEEHISEGFNPVYDIFDDGLGVSVVNGNTYRTMYFESIGGSNGSLNTCIYINNKGLTSIDGLQNDYSDTLLKINSSLTSAHIRLTGINFYPFTGKIFDAGGALLSDVSMDVGGMRFGFADKIIDTTYWVGGVIGTEITGVYRDQYKTANLAMYLKPNINSGSRFNKNVIVDGNVIFSGDDQDYQGIGGRYNLATNRPTVGWFGTVGVFVDPIAKIGWGTTDVAGDYLSRPAAGRYSFNGTGQLRVPLGTTAQRLSASASDIRSNSDSTNTPEYYDGTDWNMFASRNWVRSNFGTSINIYNTDGTFTGNRLGILGSNYLRLGYDASNYLSFAVSSGGVPTITSSSLFMSIPAVTNIGSDVANLWVPSGSGALGNTTRAEYQLAGSTTINTRFGIRGNNGGTIGAGFSYSSLTIGTNTMTEAASGTHPLLAQAAIKALSVTSGSATVTDAATLWVEGASNATVTGFNDAFRIAAGNSRFGGNVIISNGTHFYQSSLSSNNYWLGWATGAGSYTKGFGVMIDTINNLNVGSSISNANPAYTQGNNLFVGKSAILAGNTFEKYQVVTSSTGLGLTSYSRNIYIDASGGNVTLTLPAVSSVVGQSVGIVYSIKRIDNSENIVTIVPDGSDSIDGFPSITLAWNESRTIQAVGTDTWYIN